jgi:ectoine hydroxylase-related dioxygenase (phytanoyl-CoA dioxygenase family)
MSKEALKSYGIRETNVVGSPVDAAVEEIMMNGVTVIENVVAESELEEIRRRVDEVYERQASEVGGTERLRQINDELVARCLLAYDDFFLRLAAHPKITSVLEKLLGDYFVILQQNAIVNLPSKENYQTSWHRDLSYQHFVATRPLAVSALYCIDDFSEETGGTYFLPATHKIEKFPSTDFVKKHEIQINAKAGSVLVFDSMVFHRGGFNRSTGARRGINHLYGLPFIKQQIDFPSMLNGKYADDVFLAKFLGYESAAEPSVVSWRSKRLEKLDS